MQHHYALWLWISRLTLTRRRQHKGACQRGGDGPRAKRSTSYGNLPEAHRRSVPRLNVEDHPNFQIEGPTGQKQACSLPALSIVEVLASHSSRASTDCSTGLADSGSCHAHTVNSCPADTAGSGDLRDHA